MTSRVVRPASYVTRARRVICHPLAVLALAASVAISAEIPQVTGWQQVGWGGGAFYFAASWHPTDGNVIYLGSDCAGVYRTQDKGRQWRFINAGMPGYAVFSSAVGPAAPDDVWLLTTEGVVHSTNQGRTWMRVPESHPKRLNISASREHSVRAIAIDPQRAATVYAGSATGKLFKTSDAGATWSELAYRATSPAPATAMYLGSGALSLSHPAWLALT